MLDGDWSSGVCSSDLYAHQHGVIHRDVKPANLMLDEEGRVKLTDFGVARLFDANTTEGTQPGTMVGTPGYMAPEQIKGLAVGPQADIFATGVLLYQCLTFTKPFAADSNWEVYQKIVGEEPPLMSAFRAGIPPALESVVRRALAKEPANRYPSARAMADALRQSIVGEIFDDDATQVYDYGVLVPASTGSGATFQNANTATETERDFWNSIKDSGDLGELQEFIVRFPNSVFLNLATNRINKLSGQGTTPGNPLSTEDMAADTRIEQAQGQMHEDAKRKAEEEARRQVEVELRRQAEKEAQRHLVEETQRRAEREAKRKIEEDRARQRAEAAERRAQEHAGLKVEEEVHPKAEEETHPKAREETSPQAILTGQVPPQEEHVQRDTQTQVPDAAMEDALDDEQTKAQEALPSPTPPILH
jgi:hypothetical protein